MEAHLLGCSNCRCCSCSSHPQPAPAACRIRIKLARLEERGHVPTSHGGVAPAHGAERRPPCAQASATRPQAMSPSPSMRRSRNSPRSMVRRRRGCGRAYRLSSSLY
ncbi:hypothetical protein PVAP13_3NG143707 [Panicum virgatum]|uniref:Uncharacterized protein n=1 Tax=Panicum virgatum TaxID=38727 RepID=A0A8T0UCA2_PANVG|nr:hypothetical protein PVAP13_3NG143707 [Panicum virgatum]